MSQTRYHNFGRLLQSLAENLRFLGLTIPGVYSGWDRMQVVSGTSIRIHHDITGQRATNSDNATQTDYLGVCVSRQGFFIYEDAYVDFTLDYNTGNGSTRIDYLIMEHQYLSSAGGQAAVYSIIKGPNGGGEPTITNPLTQILIAKIYVPANAADHTATVYVKKQPSVLGGFAFRKLSESDIFSVENKALSNDFNAQVLSGFYFLDNSPLNAPVSAVRWTLLVLRAGTYISQLTTDTSNGKSYGRASSNSGTTWGSWVNMNNVDTVLDYTPINNQIGTRVYTEDNYVTDLQTLTQSIDALDISLKDRADSIAAQAIDISNLSSYIGNRTYDDQRHITNGESLTASINKLDKILKYEGIAQTVALRDAIPQANRYWGMVVRVVADGDTTKNYEYKLLYNNVNTTITDNANWVQLTKETGDWNMNSANSIVVAHGVADQSRIRGVKVMIRPDSDAALAGYRYDVVQGNAGTGDITNPQGGVEISGSSVGVRRRSGGFFASTDFDATGYNRGWITIDVD